jgi:hypothetical protein
MRHIKNIDKYAYAFDLLLYEPVPHDLLERYLTETDNESVIELQEFCVNESKLKFTSGISIIDAVDILVKGD